MWFTFKTSYCSSPKHIEMIVAFYLFIPETDPAISKHLKNIFEEGELDKEVVVSKMEITTQHGALEPTKFNDFAQPPQHRVATAIKPSCHHVIMPLRIP